MKVKLRFLALGSWKKLSANEVCCPVLAVESEDDTTAPQLLKFCLQQRCFYLLIDFLEN